MEVSTVGISKFFLLNGKKFEINHKNNSVIIIDQDGSVFEYQVTQVTKKYANSTMSLLINNQVHRVSFDHANNQLFTCNKQYTIESVQQDIHLNNNNQQLFCKPASLSPLADGLIKSPLAGRIVRVCQDTGAWVQQGQPLVVIESMKMENEICANSDGVIKTLFIALGNLVQPNQPLIELEMKGGRGGEPKNADGQATI